MQVYAAWRANRNTYVLKWQDPATGKWKSRSAGTTRRREAERAAVGLARQLAAGTMATTEVTWSEFRDRYEAEKLALDRPRTRDAWQTVAAHVEMITTPHRLADLDSAAISSMAAALSRNGLAKTSLGSYLRTLRAALNWAGRIWPDYVPPVITTPKVPKSKRMKGRPITREEFDRLRDAAESIVGAPYAASWRRLLWGLWLSGLRLSEVLELSWDDPRRIQVVRIDKRRPMLQIPGGAEKGGQDRLLAMAPDFARFLRKTPPERRHGRVFRPLLSRGPVRHMVTASDKIADMGRKAGIVVSTDRKTGKVKYASAHDLRRSFGDRWSRLVPEVVLMELMRHEASTTTRQYYLGRDAARTADVVWQAFWRHSCDQAESAKKRKRRKA